MTTAGAPLPLSALLAGDPITPAGTVRSRDEVLQAVEDQPLHDPGWLALAPRVVLLHSLTGATGHLRLRWLHLAPDGVLLGERPTEVVVVLAAPLRESGTAIRLVASLKACFRDPTLVDRARGARTCEDLVRILARIEEAAGTSTLSNDDVLALLKTTASGLPDAEAVRRLPIAGPNRLEEIRRRPLSRRLLDQFTSFFAVLLWIAGAIAYLGAMPQLAWAICAVIAVNGVFSFVQEYRAERAVQLLATLLPHEIIREGAARRLATRDLVPGDVVRLEKGDQIPGDGQLLAAEALSVDQSALTGESRLVLKLPARANEREGVPLYDRTRPCACGAARRSLGAQLPGRSALWPAGLRAAPRRPRSLRGFAQHRILPDRRLRGRRPPLHPGGHSARLRRRSRLLRARLRCLTHL